jgi:hypothetical protein
VRGEREIEVTRYTAPGVPGHVGDTVPATLALTLGGAADFGTFTPGVARDCTATTTATVTSTAGDATLSVADPSTMAAGRLVNGSQALARALEAQAGLAAFAPVASAPLSLLTWSAPASIDAVALGFRQRIGDTGPLRTGAYGKPLTFTLSTTSP